MTDTMIAQTDALEEFFGDFANCEAPDDWHTADVLLEIVQICLSGFYVEICEMNDGEHYILIIQAHDDSEWNVRETREPSGNPSQSSFYRFETKAGAVEALNRFLTAAI